MSCIGDERIQICRTRHLIEPTLLLRPEWTKVLVNHNKGSVAMTGPNGVTVYTVRIACDRLDDWRSGVCSLKCQNETAEITLLNTFDTTRRVKTIPPNTTRYSHDNFGHCESSIKEVEQQIRAVIFHTLRADHECDRDRRAAWTITQGTVNAKKQTSLSKWTTTVKSRNSPS